MEYVLDHGLADLSFRPLAEAVGVSHITLRHHFGSKDELLAEIFDVIRERVPIADRPTEDPEALLRTLWRRWCEPSGERHFRLLFEAYGQALMHPERYSHFLDGVVRGWLEIIRRLALEQGCPPRDAERFATVLLAQFRGLQLDLLATGDRARVDEALDHVLGSVAVERATWGPRQEAEGVR